MKLNTFVKQKKCFFCDLLWKTKPTKYHKLETLKSKVNNKFSLVNVSFLLSHRFLPFHASSWLAGWLAYVPKLLVYEMNSRLYDGKEKHEYVRVHFAYTAADWMKWIEFKNPLYECVSVTTSFLLWHLMWVSTKKKRTKMLVVNKNGWNFNVDITITIILSSFVALERRKGTNWKGKHCMEWRLECATKEDFWFFFWIVASVFFFLLSFDNSKRVTNRSAT